MADQRENSPRRSSPHRFTSTSGRTDDRASRTATGGWAASRLGASSADASTAERGNGAATRRPKKASSSGGRPPVNLWPRRIITGLGLLLIIALTVWDIVAAVQAIGRAFSASPVPQSTPQSVVQSGALDTSGYTLKGSQEATADSLLVDGTTINIPTYLGHNITATAKASPVASSSAISVTFTLENRGSITYSTSLTRFNPVATTDSHQVYGFSRCADNQRSSVTLLPRPGGTWSDSLSQDGYVYTDSYTAPAGGADTAAADTYGVTVTMGTREVGSTIVDVTPVPTPASAPAPRPGAQSSTQSGR